MDSVRPLTLRQVQVIRCVEQSIEARGFAPTRRELCSMLGITTQRGLREHLDALVKKGFLRVDAGVSRGIAVLVSSAHARLVEARPLAKAGPVAARRRVVA